MSPARLRPSTLALAAFLGLAASVAAQDVEFTFTGNFDDPGALLPPPFTDVQVGDPWTLTLCIDPTTPDEDESEHYGRYSGALSGVRFTAGGASVSGVLSGTNEIVVVNNQLVGFFGIDDQLNIWFELPGMQGQMILWTGWQSPAPTDLTSDALPQCGALDLMESSYVRIVADGGGGAWEGDADSIDCGVCLSAAAPPCTFVYSGVVTDLLGAPEPPFEELEIGDPFTVTWTLDPLTPDQDPQAIQGDFEGAVISAQLVLDGQALSMAAPSGDITVVNDFFGNIDSYAMSFLHDGGGGSAVFGFSSNVAPGPLSDDSLPLCGGALDGFTFDQSSLTVGLPSVLVVGEAIAGECNACPLPECFLVIGPSAGAGEFTAIGHDFTTQVAPVEQSFPVWLDEGPELVIWEPPASVRASVVGLGGATGAQALGGSGHGNGKGLALPLEDDPVPQLFFAQVLMWNPQVFPANPEQYSQGLAVTVTPNGRVFTAPYGTSDGGMTLWAETEWNEQGQKILRLPFSIPGF